MVTNAVIEILDLTNATLNEFNRYKLNEIQFSETPAFVEKKQGKKLSGAYEKPVFLEYDAKILIFQNIPKPTKVLIRMTVYNGTNLITPEYFEVLTWNPFPMIIQGGEILAKQVDTPVFIKI